MKRFSFILLFAMVALSAAFGQKVKIKEGAAPANPDSVAAGQGKAALRGAALMNASRDSLRSLDMQAPIAVVDTFGVQAEPQRRVYVKRADIVSAGDRLALARTQLDEATVQLELSKTDKRFKPNEIEAAAARLADQKARLEVTENKVAALRKEWEAQTGMQVIGTKDAPTTDTPPKK